MKSFPALIGLAIVSLMSCGRGPDAFARAQTAAELRSAVLAVVPIGATGDSGRRILERARFVCGLAMNATFGAGERLNYVHCDRSTKADVSVARRSQVALILTDGHISEVRASTGLIGP